MPRKLRGIVTSNKMDKTAVVIVTRTKKHPLYHKQFKLTKKYLAHDPENKAAVGAAVVISETRPLSRRKRWVIESPVAKGGKKDAAKPATKGSLK